LIGIDEALRRITEATRLLEVVEADVVSAHGRALAETVPADREFPPTDRSAMDGFAVRSGDVGEAGRSLEIAGEVRAGQPVAGISVGEGQAARIMTGAIVPPGADAVVMVEDTVESETQGTVRIDRPAEVGQHIRHRGENRKRGEAVIEPGTPIHSAEVAALAVVGRTRVKVHRAPVVSVLATGDEIIESDRVPEDHQVRNSNARALMAQLRGLDIDGDYLGIAGDNPADLAGRLAEGLKSDVMLITGGVSVGKYDLVEQALTDAGLKLLFHRISVKPGKPILAGRCGDCLVFGLPGNPVSTFVGFEVFVAPALRKMMGYRRWSNVEIPAILSEPLNTQPGRVTYHLSRVTVTSDGLTVRRVQSAGSGDVLSMSRANAFAITGADVDFVEAGSTLPVLLFRDFHLR